MSAGAIAPPTAAPSAAAGRGSRSDPSPSTAHVAGIVAAALTAAALLTAVVVRLALAGQARRWLGYRFPGVPAHLSTALWILGHNARGLAGVLGLLMVAQLAARSPGPARAQLVLRSAGEVVLAGAIAANLLVIGAAIGGYGTRMLVAMLPHGPVELAAYSLALALYLTRTSPSAPRSPHGRGCLRERGAARARRRARDLGEPMSAGRMFATLAVIAAGMLAAGLLISRAARTLHNDGLFNTGAPGLLQPGPAAPPTHQVRHGPTPRRVPATRLRRAPRRARPARRPTAAPVKLVRQRPGAKRSGGLLGLGELKVVLVAALEIAAGVALIAMLGAVLVLRRVRRRSRRRYELYELHLSTHDQAKPQDLEDMVESIANIVRAWPADRVRHGQPYLALELVCGGGAPNGRRPGAGVVDQRPLRAR